MNKANPSYSTLTFNLTWIIKGKIPMNTINIQITTEQLAAMAAAGISFTVNGGAEKVQEPVEPVAAINPVKPSVPEGFIEVLAPNVKLGTLFTNYFNEDAAEARANNRNLNFREQAFQRNRLSHCYSVDITVKGDWTIYRIDGESFGVVQDRLFAVYGERDHYRLIEITPQNYHLLFNTPMQKVIGELITRVIDSGQAPTVLYSEVCDKMAILSDKVNEQQALIDNIEKYRERAEVAERNLRIANHERDNAKAYMKRMVDQSHYSIWHALYALNYIADNLEWYIQARLRKSYESSDYRIRLKDFFQSFEEAALYLTKHRIYEEMVRNKFIELKERLNSINSKLDDLVINIKYEDGNPRYYVERISKLIEVALS